MPVDKIEKILASHTSTSGTLRKLLKHSNERIHLKQVVKLCFPKHLRHGIKSVKTAGTTLHVECSNSAIATNVRFESDDILKTLSTLSDFRKINEIKPLVGKVAYGISDS